MKRRKRKGVEEDGWGGRRSNEPTSHGVVSTRAPLPLFSFSSPLPFQQPPPSRSSFFFHRPHHRRASPPLSLVLFVPPAEPSSCSLLRLSYPSPLYYSYFHARVRSAMWFDDHPHARFFSVCARASGRACNARDMQSPRGPREEICQAVGNIVSRGGERERERKRERFFCLTFARCAAPPWKFASTVKRIHSLDREGTLFDYRVPRGDVEPSNLPSLQLPELIRGSPGPAWQPNDDKWHFEESLVADYRVGISDVRREKGRRVTKNKITRDIGRCMYIGEREVPIHTDARINKFAANHGWGLRSEQGDFSCKSPSAARPDKGSIKRTAFLPLFLLLPLGRLLPPLVALRFSFFLSLAASFLLLLLLLHPFSSIILVLGARAFSFFPQRC